tara:strand:- start:818 stop:1018 length:201 start_codon:yes stop_codon:yes gene_type:complete
MGYVCVDSNNDIIVKGLHELMTNISNAFDLNETNAIRFKKHLIPKQDNTFDIGNADYKVRDIYEQD